MKTASTSLLYTEPQLSTHGNDWFVWFRFYHNGKWQLRKYREGINRVADKKERKRYIEALAEVRLQWLQAGWNPIIDPNYKLRNVKGTTEKQEMTLNEALTYGLEIQIRPLAHKSRLGYISQIKMIKEVAEKTGFAYLKIKDIDRGHCLDIIDKLKENRIAEVGKFTNHSYNKYTATLSTILNTLVDRRIINSNPLYSFRTLDVPESDKYESYTEEEKVTIARHLISRHYNLYRVMQVVYHTGIRPKEILALKIEDINLKNRFIKIVPNEERENSKTNNVRYVPINPFLEDLLNAMRLDSYPSYVYVFGSPFEPGKGNRGAGSQALYEGLTRHGEGCRKMVR